jgi:hypothetical protein
MVPVLVVVLMAFMAGALQAGEDLQAIKTYYEKAIAQEIVNCQKQSVLRSSRSHNLRMKGHREASKALFLETHRDQLVDTMVALQLRPVGYKVQRFLEDRFSCTCYAQWAMKDEL